MNQNGKNGNIALQTDDKTGESGAIGSNDFPLTFEKQNILDANERIARREMRSDEMQEIEKRENRREERRENK